MNAMSTTAKLTVKRSGALTEDKFVITSPAIIGRFDPSVGPIDVDLGGLPEGAYVSRKHAKLTEEEGIWTVTDLGSSNGTYILRSDFEKVDSAALADGDEFALGNARFVFNLSVDETPDQDEMPESASEDPAEDPDPVTSE
jgi:pSer/pThr/pTyr-binding forkhead associated (FHA) protein